jgi:hypothetical protein
MPGDADCPDKYPVKHVFYGAFTDTRDCAQCTCSPPEGSNCTAVVSYYNDTACTMLMNATWIGEDVELCIDAMPGNELQSMSATPVDNEPGSCQASGGVPYGEATPTNSSTFCCQEGPASP